MEKWGEDHLIKQYNILINFIYYQNIYYYSYNLFK